MAGTLQQKDIKTIYAMLSSYGKDNLEMEKGKTTTITILVPKSKASRDIRKKELKSVQVMLKNAKFPVKEYAPSSGTGYVSLPGLQIYMKAKGEKGEVSSKGFKPSDIQPSIVNDWMTADQMMANVLKHIKDSDIPEDVKLKLKYVVEKMPARTNTPIPFTDDKKLMPAEFYEVLTAIRLAYLLKNQDPETMKTFGIPKSIKLSTAKIKIMIPQKSNLPLLDYFISIRDKAEEKTAMKISVKSKVASSSSNTVKFNDLFKDNAEVMHWYNSLQNKKQQTGQKIIAETAVEGGITYPITAVAELLKKDKMRISKNIKNEYGLKDSEIEGFGNILQKISSKLNTLKDADHIGDMRFLSQAEKNKLNAMLMAFLRKGAKKEKITESDFILRAVVILCEKILTFSSREKEPITEKYNFYEMFFDQILENKHIAYAVSTLKGKQLHFQYLSNVNWEQEYHSWIGLRSVNSLSDKLNSKLGLDV